MSRLYLILCNLSKYLLCSWLFISNCEHDNCFRDYSGKINFTSNRKDITLVIKKHNYLYSKWYDLDSLKIGMDQDSFIIPAIKYFTFYAA